NAADSKDDRCRGKQYTKTLSMDVDLPEEAGSYDYTWVHVYVPVMGELDDGDQVAQLRLDYSDIAQYVEPTISLSKTSASLTAGS
ncbi:hypothetical protein LI177_14625, partial [bacterium 210820-DFI.6.37]|nr:hypothetical protein [bacterium 210820-DFI.6.37]